ncbi:MAG: DUF1501 domain-containing protein [Pseudomonadota bacterium]
MKQQSVNRRAFLRSLMAAGVSTAGAVGALSTLSRAHAASSLAVKGSPADYKALVTVFLYGGNDSFNMIVPSDSRYAEYASARTNMAVPQAQLLNIPGTGFGLHPSMPGLQGLAAQSRVAMGLNVGVLQAPTNRSDYEMGRAIPPQLFSHEHQQIVWQNARPTALATNEGWLGRAADLMETAYPQQSLPFNVSLQGSNTLQVGPRSVGYAATPTGPVALDVVEENEDLAAVHDQILNQSYSHPLMQEHVAIRRRALDIYTRYASAFNPLPVIQTPFAEGNELASQLQGVARFIAVSQQLGIQRQAFFVGIGGFDTHSGQLNDHPGLLAALDSAIQSFYNATVELGMADNVTLLTLSEFGRTLGSNGDGTDHGWGGHQLVVGGAVNGGIYGQAPTLVIGGPDDADEGRLIPTLALEEFLAPAMRWYGVSESDLDVVFPNLNRFDQRDLGYMAE